MSTETKQLLVSRLEVKQLDEEARTFEGLASTWDLDLGNDVIKRGAFRETIKEWKESGRVLPLLDSHNWFSVRDAVGKLLEAKETEDGLWTRWKIVPGQDGDEILARLRPDEDSGPFVDSMSIGYVPVEWAMDEETGIRTLKKVDLHEVSLVLFPMNPEARIDSATVKDRARKDVEALLARCPEGMRCEVKAAIREATEVPDPAPEVKDEPPELELDLSPEKDAGEPPDFALFDQLRLRRLASSRTPR